MRVSSTILSLFTTLLVSAALPTDVDTLDLRAVHAYKPPVSSNNDIFPDVSQFHADDPTDIQNAFADGLPGAWYACTGIDFKGDCMWIQPGLGCTSLLIPGAGPLTPHLPAKSLGPDQGTVCELFETTGNVVGCVEGDGVHKTGSVTYPGSPNILEYRAAWVRCSTV